MKSVLRQAAFVAKRRFQTSSRALKEVNLRKIEKKPTSPSPPSCSLHPFLENSIEKERKEGSNYKEPNKKKIK